MLVKESIYFGACRSIHWIVNVLRFNPCTLPHCQMNRYQRWKWNILLFWSGNKELTPWVAKQVLCPQCSKANHRDSEYASRKGFLGEAEQEMGEQAWNLPARRRRQSHFSRQTKKGLGEKLQLHFLVLLTFGHLFQSPPSFDHSSFLREMGPWPLQLLQLLQLLLAEMGGGRSEQSGTFCIHLEILFSSNIPTETQHSPLPRGLHSHSPSEVFLSTNKV